MTNPRARRHTPVLVGEVVRHLAPSSGAVLVDATFGAGGYAQALLTAVSCRVYGIDRDPYVCAAAAEIVNRFAGRLTILHGRFSRMDQLLADVGVTAVDGVAFDLGVSSMQLDDAARGFSFRHDAALDMRMDPGEETTAADLVNGLDQAALADIIFRYGEEPSARRIARAIVEARHAAPIRTTGDLAAIVRGAVRRPKPGIDPATQTFQALRIRVNDELRELEAGLRAAERLLLPGGRLCVVSFHSLEDRTVKTFLRDRSAGAPRPSRHRPLTEGGAAERRPAWRVLTRRPVYPSAAEIEVNPRARSARLRAAERTAEPPTEDETGLRRAA